MFFARVVREVEELFFVGRSIPDVFFRAANDPVVGLRATVFTKEAIAIKVIGATFDDGEERLAVHLFGDRDACHFENGWCDVFETRDGVGLHCGLLDVFGRNQQRNVGGAFVGEDFAEEMMVTKEFAVIGCEDDPGGLIGSGDTVVEGATEEEGDGVIDMIDESVVAGHRVAHRFQAERADVGIGLQPGLGGLIGAPITIGGAPAFVAAGVVIVVKLRWHERRMRGPEREMEKPWAGRIAAFL